MLRIGYNQTENKYQIQETLDEIYEDITNVREWMLQVVKFDYDKIEAENQINLLINSLGDNIDTFNKYWFEEFQEKSWF